MCNSFEKSYSSEESAVSKVFVSLLSIVAEIFIYFFQSSLQFRVYVCDDESMVIVFIIWAISYTELGAFIVFVFFGLFFLFFLCSVICTIH